MVYAFFRCNLPPAHKVTSGEENSPTAPAGIRTRTLSIIRPALLPTSYPGPLETCTYEPTHQRCREYFLYGPTHTCPRQALEQRSGSIRVADFQMSCVRIGANDT